MHTLPMGLGAPFQPHAASQALPQPVLAHSLGFVGEPKGNDFTCWQG